MYGETNSEGWGAYLSADQGVTWKKIATYPDGVFNRISTINGDYDEFGKVYIGTPGGGFIYGTPTNNPTPPVGQVKIGQETIFLGQTTQAIAFANGDATTSVTWSSSNTEVAEVSAQGVVIGKSGGEADITATAGGSSASVKITVNPTPLVSIPDSTILLIDFDNTVPTVQIQEEGRIQMFVPADGSKTDPANFTSSVANNPDKGSINNSDKVARYDKSTNTTFQLIGFSFPQAQSLDGFLSLSFQIYGPGLEEVFVAFANQSGEQFYNTTVPVTSNNNWASVIVDFPDNTTGLKTLTIFPNPNEADSKTFYVDNIGLQFGDTPPQPNVAVTGVQLSPGTLSLEVRSCQHVISHRVTYRRYEQKRDVRLRQRKRGHCVQYRTRNGSS